MGQKQNILYITSGMRLIMGLMYVQKLSQFCSEFRFIKAP